MQRRRSYLLIGFIALIFSAATADEQRADSTSQARKKSLLRGNPTFLRADNAVRQIGINGNLALSSKSSPKGTLPGIEGQALYLGAGEPTSWDESTGIIFHFDANLVGAFKGSGGADRMHQLVSSEGDVGVGMGKAGGAIYMIVMKNRMLYMANLGQLPLEQHQRDSFYQNLAGGELGKVFGDKNAQVFIGGFSGLSYVKERQRLKPKEEEADGKGEIQQDFSGWNLGWGFDVIGQFRSGKTKQTTTLLKLKLLTSDDLTNASALATRTLNEFIQVGAGLSYLGRANFRDDVVTPRIFIGLSTNWP